VDCVTIDIEFGVLLQNIVKCRIEIDGLPNFKKFGNSRDDLQTYTNTATPYLYLGEKK
jgi:hypothetical protein